MIGMGFRRKGTGDVVGDGDEVIGGSERVGAGEQALFVEEETMEVGDIVMLNFS